MEFDALQKKLQELTTRSKKVKQQRAEILGSLNTKKEELNNLVKEIKAAGYNPHTIKQDYEETKKELVKLMSEYEAKLVEAERSLEDFYQK